MSNKNEILSLFDEKNYKLNEKNVDNKYLYITNFNILNQIIYNKLWEFNNNIENIQKYEINMGFNCGKIILKIKNIPKNIEINNLYIFIYSLEQQFAEIINFKIHSFLVINNVNEY